MEEITFEVSVVPFSVEGLNSFISDIGNMSDHQKENTYNDLMSSVDKYEERAMDHFDAGNEGEYVASLIYASRSSYMASLIKEHSESIVGMLANTGAQRGG